MQDKQEIKLTVSMVTYNHENYIERALESVLAQEHPYQYEILICDDFSTDQTRNILRQYREKYPDVIRLLFQERNVGVTKNSIASLENCKGQYIALLDGDDYWTDKTKLKKQISFLDSYREYVISCHRYQSFNTKNKKFSTDHEWHGLFSDDFNPDGFEVSYDLFFKFWLIQPATVVFRKDAMSLSEIKRYKKFKDLYLFFQLMKKGKAFIHNFQAAVYNIHDEGVWSKLSKYERWEETFSGLDELMKENRNHKELKAAYTLCLNHLYHLFRRKHKRPLFHAEGRRLLLKKIMLQGVRNLVYKD